MICKHCGAEMSPSASKCKRCGTRVPAKSDCGGFYDLASAGTKMWEDSKPAAPAPVTVYRDAPPPVPVYRTKPFMILTVVAAVLALLLMITLLTKCSADDEGGQPYTPPATTPTQPGGSDPTTPEEPDPFLPNFNITGSYGDISYFGENDKGEQIVVTYTMPSAEFTSEDGKTSIISRLPDPLSLRLNYSYTMRWATQEDMQYFEEGELGETQITDYVVLEFDLQVDENVFGTEKTHDENGEPVNPITYEWTQYNRTAYGKGNKLFIHAPAPEENVSDDTISTEESGEITESQPIKLTVFITRDDNNGGTLTIKVTGITYNEPERPVPPAGDQAGEGEEAPDGDEDTTPDDQNDNNEGTTPDDQNDNNENSNGVQKIETDEGK